MTTPQSVAIATSKDREAWLAARRTGIGSSDAPAVLGISPYASALAVYTDKLGLTEEREETEAMRWGSKLEPLVIAAFAEEAGRLCAPNNTLLRSTAREWQIATLDAEQKRTTPMEPPPSGIVGMGFVIEADTGLLEVKTTGYARDSWEEGVPAHVNAQIQHQFSVTGYSWGSVAVLVAGQKLYWADVERDDRFIDEILLPAEEEFWRRVREKIPPPPDGTDSSGYALKLLYPTSKPQVVQLPGRFIDLDKRREELLVKRELVLAELQGIEQQIKAALGDAEEGVLASGVRYTYKTQTQHRKATEAKDVSFRVFRRSESKGERL